MIVIAEAARNRWTQILPAFGIDEGFLRNRRGPCPLCGGTDRFRFDDKDGSGSWFCTKCGAGEGTKLVMLKAGLEYKAAITEISKHINGPEPPKPTRPKERTPMQKRDMLRRTWSESRCIQPTDAAGQYLFHRCAMTAFPKALRFTPRLAYRDETQTSFHPALLAQITDAEGAAVNIHRTYLDDDGWKAPVGDPRRTMEGPLPPGCAIRLAPVAETMGIAEGIETALSCQRMFGIATWASINAGLMTKWQPPKGCTSVFIFADHDESFVGQQAAYTLAVRLKHEDYDVTVSIPPTEATDWNDVHRELL